jgi:uncharacterized membrane protein
MEQGREAPKKLNVFAQFAANMQIDRMFPKTRLDALSDGIFAVAMTLLVLDVRLPDNFNPRDSADLLTGLKDLWPKVVPYVVSFYVLGMRWLANIERRADAEFLSREYVNWWLLYLLLITCVPFSTIVVGRFAHLAPAVWLYAGHTLLIALVGMRMALISPVAEVNEHVRRRRLSGLVLAGSSLLAIVLSFVNPKAALWAFVLNFATPVVRSRFDRRMPSD